MHFILRFIPYPQTPAAYTKAVYNPCLDPNHAAPEPIHNHRNTLKTIPCYFNSP